MQLNRIDQRRLQRSSELINQKMYSQYLTPARTARFMSGLFDFKTASPINLLDSGAGMGMLTAAMLDRIEDLNLPVKLTMVEIDSLLSRQISVSIPNLKKYKYEIVSDDFIEWGVGKTNEWSNLTCDSARYTHIILNPPYQKLLSTSKHRELLSSIGIEVSNLYAAFVALSLSLLKDKGELVAIIPRSFCNGLYSKAFREYILKESAILKVHLFESRDSIFKVDGVLQENIIVHLKKNVKQRNVIVSNSTDDFFLDYQEREFCFKQIVKATDSESFIRIPALKSIGEIEYYAQFNYSLKELGLEISTGPVVNYRVENHLRERSVGDDIVPLFHPQHIQSGKIKYTNKIKKKSKIKRNELTESLLYPNGYYLVMRRRTSKEEKHRFVTAVHDGEKDKAAVIGFENGLNIIHSGKKGLDREVAYGLHAYFQSKEVESYFRTFNGHTQVNVTDIRSMRFPSLSNLKQLGRAYYQSVEIEGLKFDVEHWFNQVILLRE